MNEFFYESRGKEKVKDLLQEGVTSQAYHRSGASKSGLLSKIPKLIMVILVIVGIIQMLVR